MSKTNKCHNCMGHGVSVCVKCPTCGEGTGIDLKLYDNAETLLRQMQKIEKVLRTGIINGHNWEKIDTCCKVALEEFKND